MSCPVQHSQPQKNDEKINEQNMMHKESNTPLPNDTAVLGTERAVSKIPKAALENEKSDTDTWIYPSEQQFYNAMKRKGWQNPPAQDMHQVVSIHNSVNDMVWDKILEYEKFHCTTCPTPKLFKFKGDTSKTSPKAFIKSKMMGYKAPFDRHDWIVDRCGKHVRYVIDFYDGRLSPQEKLQGKVSIYADVRPALESTSSFIDRVKFLMSSWQT